MPLQQPLRPIRSAGKSARSLLSAKPALIAMAALLCAACQSASTTPEQVQNFRAIEYFLIARGLEVTGPASGVRESAIRDWGRVNDQALILEIGARRQVLVTLKDPCENLDEARVIGFERTLGYVVPDPMGNGFDIRETFSEYLSPGDKILLAYTSEELEQIQWQQMGPTSGQLGECTAAQLYYLAPFQPPAEEEEQEEVSQL